MLSGTCGPWYLQGRQFGLRLMSQRLLGKLSSFYTFIDCTSYFIPHLLLAYAQLFLYSILVYLVFSSPAYFLFIFIFSSFAIRSQTVVLKSIS